KVRSMWTLIMEMLTSLKKEKEVVDSLLVLRDGCGQYILDGSNDFRIPQLLIHRVENDIHNLFTGNLYEDEKLNFLTVIRLLNEALRTLREEHCLSELNKLPAIENKIKPCKESLEHCSFSMFICYRQEIEQQRCMPRSGKQEDWELKWKSFLGVCPFNLLFDQDPVSSVQCL
ncbi:HAUS6 protein, partial [Chloroceryle aenea]|nr:HAUS6 protein [Chloroceryle aenea]